MNPLASSMAVLVVLALMSIFMSYSVSANYRIEIKNNVDSAKEMEVHCQSADKDLGVHYLKHEENLDWSLNMSNNINLSPPFCHCDIIWEKVAKGHIVVFDARRGDLHNCGTNCKWLINYHGFYVLDVNYGIYRLKNKWERLL